MTVGGTQMPACVSTGDRDAVLRQIRWCAAVQTLVNCHCQLEDTQLHRAGFKCVGALGRIIIRGPYAPSNAIIYMHFYE